MKKVKVSMEYVFNLSNFFDELGDIRNVNDAKQYIKDLIDDEAFDELWDERKTTSVIFYDECPLNLVQKRRYGKKPYETKFKEINHD